MEHWRNPVGVARIIAAIPKVAEYSNPWALGLNHYVVEIDQLRSWIAPEYLCATRLFQIWQA